jgi:predicted nucleotidyltransferase
MTEIADASFGIAPNVVAKLRQAFDGIPELDAVWVYGSRARGHARLESDIDLAVDAREMDDGAFRRLRSRLDALDLIYRLDVVHLQTIRNAEFRARIERDRKVF